MRTTRKGGGGEEQEHHHHHHRNNNKKQNKHSHQRRDSRICRALCCSSNTRFSISSSSSSEESSERKPKLSDRHGSLSSLTHYMVQEKLEQMIRERQEAIHRENARRKMRRKRMMRSEGGRTTKFIVMMAMEKCSYDPREDFRDSMIEMIVVNRINGAKELRSLLEYYLSMNTHEHKCIILEIFHEVCTHLFLSS